MNKREARRLSLDCDYTVSDLQRIIDEASERDGPSVVNPALNHAQAVEILRAGLGDDESRAMTSPINRRVVMNILRECGA